MGGNGSTERIVTYLQATMDAASSSWPPLAGQGPVLLALLRLST